MDGPKVAKGVTVMAAVAGLAQAAPFLQTPGRSRWSPWVSPTTQPSGCRRGYCRGYCRTVGSGGGGFGGDGGKGAPSGSGGGGGGFGGRGGDGVYQGSGNERWRNRWWGLSGNGGGGGLNGGSGGGAIGDGQPPSGTPVAPAARAEEEKAETTQTLRRQRSRRSDQRRRWWWWQRTCLRLLGGNGGPGGKFGGGGGAKAAATGAQEAISAAGAVPLRRVVCHPVTQWAAAVALAVAEVVPLGVAPERAASVAGAAPTLIIFVKAARCFVDLAVLIHSYELGRRRGRRSWRCSVRSGQQWRVPDAR